MGAHRVCGIYINAWYIMKNITFYENKYENNHMVLAVLLLCKGVWNVGLAIVDLLGFVHEKMIKRYPLAMILIIIFVAVMWSMIEIGKARAERDMSNKKLYEVELRLHEYETSCKIE